MCAQDDSADCNAVIMDEPANKKVSVSENIGGHGSGGGNINALRRRLALLREKNASNRSKTATQPPDRGSSLIEEQKKIIGKLEKCLSDAQAAICERDLKLEKTEQIVDAYEWRIKALELRLKDHHADEHLDNKEEGMAIPSADKHEEAQQEFEQTQRTVMAQREDMEAHAEIRTSLKRSMDEKDSALQQVRDELERRQRESQDAARWFVGRIRDLEAIIAEHAGKPKRTSKVKVFVDTLCPIQESIKECDQDGVESNECCAALEANVEEKDDALLMSLEAIADTEENELAHLEGKLAERDAQLEEALAIKSSLEAHVDALSEDLKQRDQSYASEVHELRESEKNLAAAVDKAKTDCNLACHLWQKAMSELKAVRKSEQDMIVELEKAKADCETACMNSKTLSHEVSNLQSALEELMGFVKDGRGPPQGGFYAAVVAKQKKETMDEIQNTGEDFWFAKDVEKCEERRIRGSNQAVARLVAHTCTRPRPIAAIASTSLVAAAPAASQAGKKKDFDGERCEDEDFWFRD